MRVLLDEHLARLFPVGLDVRSAQWMGWAGMSNGELLRAAGGFDVVVTADRSMRYQQPHPPLPVLLLEAGGTSLRDLQPCVPQIARALSGPLEPGYYLCEPRTRGPSLSG